MPLVVILYPAPYSTFSVFYQPTFSRSKHQSRWSTGSSNIGSNYLVPNILILISLAFIWLSKSWNIVGRHGSTSSSIVSGPVLQESLGRIRKARAIPFSLPTWFSRTVTYLPMNNTGNFVRISVTLLSLNYTETKDERIKINSEKIHVKRRYNQEPWKDFQRSNWENIVNYWCLLYKF